jgi:hypothetical protein
MKIVTTQMIRDKLAVLGPMTYIDMIKNLDLEEEADSLIVLSAINRGVATGAFKCKIVNASNGKEMIYWTDWKDTTKVK